jgi:hypothetical protein
MQKSDNFQYYPEFKGNYDDICDIDPKKQKRFLQKIRYDD